MLRLIIASVCLIAACQAQTLQMACQTDVMMAGGTLRVTDALSDTMGLKASQLLTPTLMSDPLAMSRTAGLSPGWRCLLRETATPGIGGTMDVAKTAGKISDYFDTVVELKPLMPGFDPCSTVFCGEKGMTPSMIAGAVVGNIRRNMGMASNLMRFFSPKDQNYLRQRQLRNPFGARRGMGMGGTNVQGRGMGYTNPMGFGATAGNTRTPTGGNHMGAMMNNLMSMMNTNTNTNANTNANTNTNANNAFTNRNTNSNLFTNPMATNTNNNNPFANVFGSNPFMNAMGMMNNNNMNNNMNKPPAVAPTTTNNNNNNNNPLNSVIGNVLKQTTSLANAQASSGTSGGLNPTGSMTPTATNTNTNTNNPAPSSAMATVNTAGSNTMMNTMVNQMMSTMMNNMMMNNMNNMNMNNRNNMNTRNKMNNMNNMNNGNNPFVLTMNPTKPTVAPVVAPITPAPTPKGGLMSTGSSSGGMGSMRGGVSSVGATGGGQASNAFNPMGGVNPMAAFGLGGMPGMGATGGMPGMGGMSGLLSAMMLGEGMADAPDPRGARAGMFGSGMGGNPFAAAVMGGNTAAMAGLSGFGGNTGASNPMAQFMNPSAGGAAGGNAGFAQMLAAMG